jgi:hypothetical protein
MVIGRNRNELNSTAIAATGKAVPVAIDQNSST